jgi:rhodanese-related sulfurtransferase
MSKRSKKKPTKTGSQQKYIIAFVLIACVILGAVFINRAISSRSVEQSAASTDEVVASTIPPVDTTGLPAEITPSQAAQMQADGSLILDVRQPDEWAEVHIEGATLIPLTELENRLTELPLDQNIVVVCRSGNRSSQGRDTLLANGFTWVTSMAGGMNAWQAAGLPVVNGN